MSTSNCQNCNHKLSETDLYCSNCGQKKNRGQYNLKSLILNFLEDYISFDNKIFRTLVILFFKPGELSIAFMEGKRMKYVPPIRLFLFITFISIAIISIFDLDTQFIDKSVQLSTLAESELEKNEFEGFSTSVKGIFFQNFSKIILLQLPIMAFFTYLIFYKKERYYFEALIYTLHGSTIFFLAYVLNLLLLISESDIITNIIYFVSFCYAAYLTISAKRFYKANYLNTILKVLFLLTLQVLLIAILFGVVFLIQIYLIEGSFVLPSVEITQ